MTNCNCVEIETRFSYVSKIELANIERSMSRQMAQARARQTRNRPTDEASSKKPPKNRHRLICIIAQRESCATDCQRDARERPPKFALLHQLQNASPYSRCSVEEVEGESRALGFRRTFFADAANETTGERRAARPHLRQLRTHTPGNKKKSAR